MPRGRLTFVYNCSSGSSFAGAAIFLVGIESGDLWLLLSTGRGWESLKYKVNCTFPHRRSGRFKVGLAKPFESGF